MRYLSDEWIDAADRAVRVIEPTAEPFAVSYSVTGGPDGDRAYTVDVGTPSVSPGADAAVGLRMTWNTACAIAQGEQSAQRAFLDGDVRLEGNAQELMNRGEVMAAVETALAAVRSETTYD